MAGRKLERFGAGVLRGLCRYVRDRHGNISTMVALLIIPLVGVMGLGTETANWYMIHRSMQNAADSAVLAAGQTGTINFTGTTYITEGRSVAASFGFTNGVNSTTVTPVKNQPCPAGVAGSNCFKVTISRDVPIGLIRVLGYNGTGGSGSQTVTASAMAKSTDTPTTYCILALGASGQGIRINGGPNVDLSGCNLMSNCSSNNSTNCNGQNPGADIVTAVGTADPNCGGLAISGASTMSDPYASKATTNASDLDATSCLNNFTPKMLGSVTSGGVQTKCGPQTLTANITITSNTTLVIQNGSLDLAGNTISTTAGAGLTIIFNTTVGQANVVPFANNSGTLDFAAPTSGNWSGVALYQNRQNGSTAVVSQTYAGNSPTWDITGLVYLPYIDLDFKGIVNKSSLGYTCFALVVNNLLISGNGAIYANPMSQCIQAGLVLPTNSTPSRVSLVQ